MLIWASQRQLGVILCIDTLFKAKYISTSFTSTTAS